MTTNDVKPIPCPTWTVTTQKVIHVPSIPEGSGADVLGLIVVVVVALGILGVVVMAILGLIESDRREVRR